jgi:hypothetical protein
VIEIGKLPLDTILMVETEKYLYKLEVVDPSQGLVQVETGDSYIGNGLFYSMVKITEGHPMVFIHPAGNKRVRRVQHVGVCGINASGPWSYEVF